MKLRMLVVVAVGCLAMPAMAHAQAAKATTKSADCPKGCPTSKGAAGLTGVQFLALQQELRDRDCGNAHVTGWLDAETRHAISVCAKKHSVANKAAAVLAAMDIGYSASELGPGGGAAISGEMKPEAKESPSAEKAVTKRAGAKPAARKKAGMKMKADTAAKRDSTIKD